MASLLLIFIQIFSIVHYSSELSIADRTENVLNSNENKQLFEDTTAFDFVEKMDFLLQIIRQRHGEKRLDFSNELAYLAHKESINLAANKEKFDEISEFGKSMYFSSGEKDTAIKKDPSEILEYWYKNEEKLYDYSNPNYSPEYKDFLQIISSTTTHYGCAQAYSHDQKAKGLYTVCYFAPIYKIGNEKKNIKSPIFDLPENMSNNEILKELEMNLTSLSPSFDYSVF